MKQWTEHSKGTPEERAMLRTKYEAEIAEKLARRTQVKRTAYAIGAVTVALLLMAAKFPKRW